MPQVSKGAYREGCAWRLTAHVKLLALVAYFAVALHARSPVALGLCLAAALAMALAVRLPARSALKVVRPLAAILVFTAIMQVLFVQQGDVLVRIGPVAVTRVALSASVAMIVGFVCVMVSSVAFARCTPTERFLDMLAVVLLPLGRLGVNVDAFMLALTVALSYVPVLARDFAQLKRAQLARAATFDGGVRLRLAAYARLFPPLLRSSFRRADRLADSMVARCFGADVRRTSLNAFRPGAPDAVFALASVAFCALVVVV